MYSSNVRSPSQTIQRTETDREGSTDMSTSTTNQTCKQERKGSFFKVCATPIIVSVWGKIIFTPRTVKTVDFSHSSLRKDPGQ